MPYERFHEKQWTNKTFGEVKAFKALEAKVERLAQDWETLKAQFQGEPFYDEAERELFATLDLGAAITAAHKAEEERRRIAELKAAMEPEPVEEPEPEPEAVPEPAECQPAEFPQPLEQMPEPQPAPMPAPCRQRRPHRHPWPWRATRGRSWCRAPRASRCRASRRPSRRRASWAPSCTARWARFTSG